MFKDIDNTTFQKIQQEENTIVLDVRTAQEHNEGYIEGAQLHDIMNGDFVNTVPTLDKTKTYLIYCRSGARSANACSYLVQNGFENVYNLRGGILGWDGDIKS